MKKNYSSDPKGRKFISLAALILTVVLLALLNVLRLYAIDKFPQYIPDTATLPVRVITALMIAFAAVYVIFVVILLPSWYRTIRYVITNREIISYSGLFSRTYRLMKVDSVLHAVRISLPLSKITSFSFISLKAMGGSMLLMFLSDSDCTEILEFFRRRCDAPPVQYKGKYSVASSDSKAKDYVYKDNASILSPEEISEIAVDFDSVRQLTFDDMSSAQLTFSDIDRNSGEEDAK